MKVLVIQNDAKGDIGAVGHLLEERHGAEVQSIAPQHRSLDEVHPEAADLFIILGSPHSVYEEGIAWIAQEIALARRLIAADRPLFGICFGAQILATALGGAVRSTGQQHFGWLPIEEPT